VTSRGGPNDASARLDPARSSRPACGIVYVPEAYEGDQRLVVGRQSAGAGFLDAYIRYSGDSDLCCVTPLPATFDEFKKRVARVDPTVACRMVHPTDADALARIGCLYQPGPVLGESAWLRRRGDERAYSLCGVTHSIATERVTRGIRDYLTAPTHAWDALVCTSQAARQAALRIIESWREYLTERGFTVPELPLEFAIIPLGVDAARFAPTDERRARGRALRRELQIADDDVVVLYYGRLSVQSKAHPTPMLRALELAQRGVIDIKLHFILCGQFGDPVLARELDAVRHRFCPSVPVHWIDGMDRERGDAAWYASDMFLSLSDNVQESFGLTTLEAQAAGLPVVASDWDGYRDTVAHNDTGILIPTYLPKAGAGVPLANAHAFGVFDQNSLLALTAQSTVVDIDAAADAIVTLATHPDQRRRMGDRGVQRATDRFDWRTIVAAYQDLWSELAARRARALAVGTRHRVSESVHPDFPDPFWIFEGHASEIIGDDSTVVVAEVDASETLELLRQNAIHMFATPHLLGPADVAALLANLSSTPGATVADLTAKSSAPWTVVHSTLAWMAKFGLVRIERA
jgi:alpha-maltose-1-phosphate synthase